MTPDDPRPPQPDPEDTRTPDDTPAAFDDAPSPSLSPASSGASPSSPVADAPAEADDVDELASALLDGELSLDDPARQRVEVVARAAELGTARTTVRDVPAADPVARERALAAALAAFDEEAPPASASPLRPAPPTDAHGSVPGPITPPVDLAGHRQSRPGDARDGRVSGGRQGLPRWFGAAAAAVVVLAGLVGLAALSSESDDGDSAMDSGTAESHESSDDERADTTAAEDDAVDGSAAPPPAGADEQDAHRSVVEAGDLGMFPTGDALVDHLRDTVGDDGLDADLELLPEAGTSSGDDGVAPGAFAACDGAPPPPLDDPGAVLVLHGRAVIGGEAADVWLIETDRGRRIVAIDDACELVLDRPLS